MQSVAISSKTLQSCFFNSHKFLSAYISVSINSGPGLATKEQQVPGFFVKVAFSQTLRASAGGL